ncbi:MAG: hypothetical protein JWP27_289 [Flaviaesturariibacter sp.]|nr:hypothetical protein [Flaviaesturariibacter sp.]
MPDSPDNRYTLAQVGRFLEERLGEAVPLDADIFADLGCTGIRFTQLISAFGLRFDVDISAYRWYFHTNEDETTIGAMFFKPPYERVERIAVTPEMLLQFANSGWWDITYPEHEIPSSRADIFITILVIFAVIFLLMYVAGKT